MKKYALVLIVGSFLVINCSEKNSDSIDNLPSEIVWEFENKSIINVLDSIPKVLIKGIKRANSYVVQGSFLEEDEYKLILNGKIRALGDLNQDGIPEFVFEDIVETRDSIYGYRYLLSVFEGSKLQSITRTQVAVNKRICPDILGRNEQYSYDNTYDGNPYLVVTGNYGYSNSDENCLNYQQAQSTYYYTLASGNSWLKPKHRCSIEEEEINLATLYELNSTKLRHLPSSTANYYDIYAVSTKLTTCDENNEDYTNIEKVAGIKVFGGSHKKRTDLMPFIEEEFQNINPEIIKWASKNLIPTPSQKQVNGLTYRFIYEQRFKDLFRKFAALKLIIMQQGEEALLREYAQATYTKRYIESEDRTVYKENTYTYSFLQQKMNWMQELFTKEGFDTKTLESIDYGFMMRRMLDGSEPEIWNLIKSILRQYDGDWYAKTFVNKKWKGIVAIDSNFYFNNRLRSGADSIIFGKEAIPEGITIVNGAGITITCKNGKEVTFINDNGDEESQAFYELIGYWPQKEMILVNYTGWEWGNTILVDLNTGESDYRSWGLYPSQDGQYLAETVDEMEYQAFRLFKLESSKWVDYKEYPSHSISDGFWVDSIFYFREGKQFYTIGELNYNKTDQPKEAKNEVLNQDQINSSDSLSL